MGNLENGNIKEENKPGDNYYLHVICPPGVIYKYYAYTHDNVGHKYTLYIIIGLIDTLSIILK